MPRRRRYARKPKFKNGYESLRKLRCNECKQEYTVADAVNGEKCMPFYFSEFQKSFWLCLPACRDAVYERYRSRKR